MVVLQFLCNQPLLAGHESELNAVVAALHNQACSSLYSTEEKNQLLDRVSLAISHSLQNPFKYRMLNKGKGQVDDCNGGDASEVVVSDCTCDTALLETQTVSHT